LHDCRLYDIFYFVRLVRFRDGGSARLGALADGALADLTGAGLPSSVEELLRSGEGWREQAERAIADAARVEEEVQLLAPVARPSKILCLGMNFRSHAEEVGVEEESAEPTVFSKLASSLTGPSDPIVLPAEAPDRVDYEAELAVVIGRSGRNVPVEQAAEWVAGYTVANDVSARDWQLKKPAGQWLLGKSFDTFLPFGPALVTPDEAPPPDEMVVRCTVSGEVLQEASIADMIVGIPEAIAYVSRVCTLEPGDVILAGTPDGVGMARQPRRFLLPGDVVETSVSGVGMLRNPVTSADAS
jgi:2-keto-4-pentenoate hydratase/2-oxohepta-3-ene-1,7-dioic acid hydratase in catechol pathway